METGNIKHIGVVTAVDSFGKLTVKISRNQCDGCQLGKLCNVSGDDELTIDVPVSEISNFNVGTKVLVEEGQNLEKRAIWLCLVIPCSLLLLLVILGALWSTATIGAVLGLLSMVIYFGTFYLLRDKVEYNKISYKITKL